MVDFIFEYPDKAAPADLLVVLWPLDERALRLTDGAKSGRHIGVVWAKRSGNILETVDIQIDNYSGIFPEADDIQPLCIRSFVDLDSGFSHPTFN